MFIDYVVLCCYIVAMYIESVPNRNSPPAILLRESFRDGDLVIAMIVVRLIAPVRRHPAGKSFDVAEAAGAAVAGKSRAEKKAIVGPARTRTH